MILYSQAQNPSLKSLPEDLCSGFLRPEKIHRPQSDFNPGTLDLEESTLPRDHRGRLGLRIKLSPETNLTRVAKL